MREPREVGHRSSGQAGPCSGEDVEPHQAFLFTYYGLILQAEENSTTVRIHLKTLLETSHQWAKQREVRAQTGESEGPVRRK